MSDERKEPFESTILHLIGEVGDVMLKDMYRQAIHKGLQKEQDIDRKIVFLQRAKTELVKIDHDSFLSLITEIEELIQDEEAVQARKQKSLQPNAKGIPSELGIIPNAMSTSQLVILFKTLQELQWVESEETESNFIDHFINDDSILKPIVWCETQEKLVSLFDEMFEQKLLLPAFAAKRHSYIVQHFVSFKGKPFNRKQLGKALEQGKDKEKRNQNVVSIISLLKQMSQ